MAVIYPDIEKVLVTYFNEALDAVGSELTSGVRVATKHSQPDEATPAKQIVLIVAFNGEYEAPVTKTASLTIDVYADDYATASSLSLLVESLVRGCVGNDIKRASVRLGPVRTTEESMQERRSLDVELVVKGTEL